MSADDTIAGEEEIVSLLAPLAAGSPGAFGLQDDCAVLRPKPGTELVLKTDPVAEGVHFLPGTSPEDIAWRALAVNVSDLAAKGATPLGFLMALSFPQSPQRAWVARFAEGLRQAQEHMHCRLLGGDTDRRPGPMTVSITIFGEVPQGAMVRRATARPGDAIFVTGTLGDALLGLELCRDGALATSWGLTPLEAESLRWRFLRPQPRLALQPALRAHARAAIGSADMRRDRAQPVMTGVAAALLHAQLGGRQIKLVMKDDDVLRRNLEELRRRGDRRPGLVHVGLRLHQQNAFGADGRFAAGGVETRLPGRSVVCARDRLRRHEADIVSVHGVAVARIAEPDEEKAFVAHVAA